MSDLDMQVKYPNITVRLTSEDGNSFFILGKVIKSLKRGGIEKENIDKFSKEAMSGDYNHLLQTCMQWVNVE